VGHHAGAGGLSHNDTEMTRITSTDTDFEHLASAAAARDERAFTAAPWLKRKMPQALRAFGLPAGVPVTSSRCSGLVALSKSVYHTLHTRQTVAL
jgi:hypothetical protein